MKTIGLLGGMSWESTIPYYRHANEVVKAQLGGLHSARIVLYSVNFAEVEEMQRSGDWDGAGALLGRAASSLVAAGADFIVICTNTMHKVVPAIEAAIGAQIPILHIADPTAEAVKSYHLLPGKGPAVEGAECAPITCVGLLGTRFTMEQSFYKDRLSTRHGLKVVVPSEEDRAVVHRIIYEELCLGVIKAASREAYEGVMQRLVQQGAQAIILGCTEISLLVGSASDAVDVPLFDTTMLHAKAAGSYALKAE